MAHEPIPPAWIQEFIAGSLWHFAKTMPQTPHEYTLLRETTDPETFRRFVLHIRSHGYQKRFRANMYTYLDVGGMSYWTMGAPLQQTILINRAGLCGA